MKKKTLSELHSIGEVLTVDMLKSENGPLPIARTDGGAICLLKIEKGTYIPYGSTWEVEVVEIHEKKLIIKPLECLRSAAANAFNLEKKLVETFGAKKEKKEKTVRHYQFERKG